MDRRIFGRRSDAERRSEQEHESLLTQIASGDADARHVGAELQRAAVTAGLGDRKAAQLRERTFRAFAARVLRDDRLSEDEENELIAVAEALGIGQRETETRYADVMQQMLVARINDGRLLTVPNARLITKPGEVVHSETAAQLMKEVVHREYQGGGGGISVPLGLGIRGNVGGSRGKSVVVGTSLEAADTGFLTITDSRVVFRGARTTQESRFDRLTGIEVFEDGIRIGVSNRQSPSLYRVPKGVVAGATLNVAVHRKLYGT